MIHINKETVFCKVCFTIKGHLSELQDTCQTGNVTMYQDASST